MHATTLAIDLAKDVFELAFADSHHQVIERKRLRRAAFARCLDAKPPLRIVMEACSSAHYWGRRFERAGHQVRLIPARDVRPYVRRNKTDRTDVAGLLEADRCAQIDSVPIKTPELQSVQALHRIREHCKSQCVASINLVRGVLREFGIVIALGANKVRPAVLAALEDAENELSMALREHIHQQLQHIQRLQQQMQHIEQQLQQFAKEDAACKRYLGVPGIGLITATALRSSVGDLQRFKSGRHLSAYLGLVPKEYSSGNQRHLGRISKRGDRYLRMLIIHGARAALCAAMVQQRNRKALDRMQRWTIDLQQRSGYNKAAVALANKMICRLWAMEHHGKAFDREHISTLSHAMVSH
jgi:transposase